MFCVFPQGWITSSWCDGPVSTSTGQNRQRDCTHHAKLRMTQFLLQPEISHYYFVSWIKSVTCERQRPCRVYWDPPLGHGSLTMLKELWSWESKAHLIICLQTQVNFDLPTCSETTHECLSRYWFADTWGIQHEKILCTQKNTPTGPGWCFTCASAAEFKICMSVKEELMQIHILKKLNVIIKIMSGWYNCLDILN